MQPQQVTAEGVFFFWNHFRLSLCAIHQLRMRIKVKVHFYERASRGKTTMSSEAWAVHKEKHRDHQPSTVGM